MTCVSEAPGDDLLASLRREAAEQFRAELNANLQRGLLEHSEAGWNIGPAPYGYTAARIRHPDPALASLGRTKSRLILDPARAPVVTQIFTWRTGTRLGVPTIAARLNADPGRYPPPAGGRWSTQGVAAMLRNPKYTGHMVYGRTTKRDGHTRPVPPEQWTWSPEPAHPPLVSRATWEAAQRVGASRGNVRDAEVPGGQRGRRYLLRGRVRCRICRRRMTGGWSRSTRAADVVYVYYKCPYDPAAPAHVAACPDHPSVSVREDLLTGLAAGFLGDCIRAAGGVTPELRAAAGALDDAPYEVREALLAAFDVQILYDKRTAGITTWATIPAG
jgi:site-specific DNA recombinase